MLLFVPAMITNPALVTTPANVPPLHWKRPLVKSKVRFGVALIVPLLKSTWPPPLPAICPAHVGWLPPVKSKAAPVATVNVPLELFPPPLRTNSPLSTSIAPSRLSNVTEMPAVLVPPLFQTTPWLTNGTSAQQAMGE